MQSLKIQILILPVIFSMMGTAQACEPAAIDWEGFEQSYDLDHNQSIDLREFQKVSNFAPYPWPEDQHYQGENGKNALFKSLDQNKDGQLSDQELFEIYALLPNPCEGWPWHK